VSIVRENRSYVLISHEEWESLIETAELIKVPNLLEQVKSARQEYQKGEALSMDHVFG
jgi:PHD/YefM family antitoxin component YafN of YafNO toxin-antitoxin module